MDIEFIGDLFAQFRPVTVRRMFSGAGLYCDGVMFGLVVRGTIYLKADATNSADFVREGSGPFTYTRGKASGRPSEHALSYWRLPDRLYDDPEKPNTPLGKIRGCGNASCHGEIFKHHCAKPASSQSVEFRKLELTKNSAGRCRSQV